MNAGLAVGAREHPWSSVTRRLKAGCGQDCPPHIYRSPLPFAEDALSYLAATSSRTPVIMRSPLSNDAMGTRSSLPCIRSRS